MWSARASCLFIVLSICLFGASLGWELQGLSSYTVPVFMWSDKLYFTKTQVVDTVSTGDVEFALSSLLNKESTKDSKLSNLFNDNVAAPEVIVLFVEPELRTDQVPYIASAFSSVDGGSFSHLKSAVETAGSSLMMPYATVSEVTLLDEALSETFDAVDGSIFMSSVSGSTLFSRLRQLSNVNLVNLDSLMTELTNAQVFTNGRTDIVVVCFDKAADQSFTQHDSIIGTLSESIRAASKGNYVAMYAANMPAAKPLTWTFDSKSEFEQSMQLYLHLGNDTTNGTNGTNNTNNTVPSDKINYFPGPFIEILVISAILLTMAFTGACAIFSLQTPDKWEIPKAKQH